MILRIFGLVISGIVSLVIYFEISNFKFSSDEPNKDRLLVDLVSYVLDKLHYDPQIINDDFSILYTKLYYLEFLMLKGFMKTFLMSLSTFILTKR